MATRRKVSVKLRWTIACLETASAAGRYEESRKSRGGDGRLSPRTQNTPIPEPDTRRIRPESRSRDRRASQGRSGVATGPGRTGGRPTMRRPSYPAAPAGLRPPVGRGLPAGGRLAVTGACGKARGQQVTQDGILAGLEQAQDPRGRPLEWANEPPRAKRAGRFVRPYRAPCAISRRRARTRRRVGRRGEPVAPPVRIEGWGRRSWRGYDRTGAGSSRAAAPWRPPRCCRGRPGPPRGSS